MKDIFNQCKHTWRTTEKIKCNMPCFYIVQILDYKMKEVVRAANMPSLQSENIRLIGKINLVKSRSHLSIQSGRERRMN